MEKLNMQTTDVVDENIKRIVESRDRNFDPKEDLQRISDYYHLDLLIEEGKPSARSWLD